MTLEEALQKLQQITCGIDRTELEECDNVCGGHPGVKACGWWECSEEYGVEVLNELQVFINEIYESRDE